MNLMAAIIIQVGLLLRRMTTRKIIVELIKRETGLVEPLLDLMAELVELLLDLMVEIGPSLHS
jgi:hypothetical protein